MPQGDGESMRKEMLRSHEVGEANRSRWQDSKRRIGSERGGSIPSSAPSAPHDANVRQEDVALLSVLGHYGTVGPQGGAITLNNIMTSRITSRSPSKPLGP